MEFREATRLIISQVEKVTGFLACFMYVGFKQLMPDADLNLDLAKEYAAAKVMHETKGKSQ